MRNRFDRQLHLLDEQLTHMGELCETAIAKATQALTEKLAKEYGTSVMAVNCDQLRQEDILEILKNVLLEFPLSSVGFYLPKWVETLRDDHWMKKSILDLVKEFMADKGNCLLYTSPSPRDS